MPPTHRTRADAVLTLKAHQLRSGYEVALSFVGQSELRVFVVAPNVQPMFGGQSTEVLVSSTDTLNALIRIFV